MKKLRYITMVNWWLFDRPLVVEVRDNVLLYGANGAGKSSIFDAIQTVFVGGDASKLRFNQRADERSKRNLRSYCLGIATTDPEDGKRAAELDPRKSALTHLVLTFEDEKGTFYNAGVLVSATESQAKAEVEARYTMVGPRLLPEHLSDDKRAFDKKALEASLSAVEERALRQMRSRQPKLKLLANTTLYQREFTAMLSGPGGLIDPQRLIKAFLGALHFRTENDIDSFIRHQILEEDPMLLENMRRSLNDYRTIRDKVEECIRRLTSLKAIDKLYGDAHERERKRDEFQWMAAEATVLYEQIDAMFAEDRVDACDRKKNDAELAVTGTENQIQSLQQQRGTLREQLAAHQEDSRLTAVEAQIKGAEQRVEVADSAATAAMQIWDNLHRVTAKEKAPADLKTAAARLAGLGNIYIGGGLPSEAEVAATSFRVFQDTKAWIKDIKSEHERQRDLRNKARDHVEELQERLDNLSSGGLDLPSQARRLLQALAAKRIEATPVCSLIEVADPEWRDAIEAHLGGARFSVIVQPADVGEAYRVLRTPGVHGRLHGVRVFDTRKLDQFLARVPVGDSVASRLRTDNRMARAWLYHTLGGVRMAEDEHDQREKGRSLTKDGVYYDGAHFILPNPVSPALGKGATEVLVPVLREQLRESTAAQSAAISAMVTAEVLYTELDRLSLRLEDRLQVGQSMRQAVTARNELSGFRSAVEAMTNPETKRLRGEVESLETKIETLGRSMVTQKHTAEQSRTEHTQAEAARLTAVDRCNRATDQRLLASGIPGLDRGQASRVLEELQQRFLEQARQAAPTIQMSPGEETHSDLAVEYFQNKLVAQEAVKKQADMARLATDKLSEARELLGEHRVTYKIEGLPPDATDATREQWTLSEINRVEAGELHHYEAQAKLAQTTVAKTIRGDFSGHLIAARKRMRAVIDERNSLLKTHTFSNNERYRFVANPIKEYSKIVEWLESIEAQDAAKVYDASYRMDLFSDSKYTEAQAQVMEILEKSGDLPAERLKITDYRSYFSFDMLVDSPTAGTVSVQKRLKAASGGERFTPLYIAVATAVSGAYRIETRPNGQHHGGAALALFDEAFNNMDADNIDSSMGVLLGVGIQVMIACPDEKAPTLRQYADTHLKMVKDGGTAVVERVQLTEKGKNTLRADFPEELRSLIPPVQVEPLPVPEPAVDP